MQNIMEIYGKIHQNIYDHSDKLSGPLHISIDVTNRCNANCLHCFNRSSDNQLLSNYLIGSELTDMQFLNIIKQAAEEHPFSVCFCGGEPMLRYDVILKACNILNQAGIKNINKLFKVNFSILPII